MPSTLEMQVILKLVCTWMGFDVWVPLMPVHELPLEEVTVHEDT